MGISPLMAVRLSIVLKTSSEMWVNMQAMCDLFQAEQERSKLKLKPLVLRVRMKEPEAPIKKWVAGDSPRFN